MTKTDRFPDLAAVRAEKARLDAVRDHHGEQLENHFNALRSGSFRSAMLKNTMRSAMGNFAPGRMLGSLIGNGGLGGGLTMALGAGKGGLMKRIGLFALGLAAPKLMQKMDAISIPDIGHELRVSWDRMKDHLEARRAARARD